MVKVHIFDTLEKAVIRLDAYFHKNNLVWTSMISEFKARESVYRKSAGYQKRHGADLEAPLTGEETFVLGTNIGKREEVSSFSNLVAHGISGYGFYHNLMDLNNSEFHGPCDSIASLVEATRQTNDGKTYSHLGIKVSPIYYTVRQPFTYSESQKDDIKKALKFSRLTEESQGLLEKYLDNYIERCLTSQEIQEFLKGHTKFLN